MTYSTQALDAADQIDAALHRVPAVTAELIASLVRIPLLAAQLAMSIIAVPFLALQLATTSLGQMVERMDGYVEESIRTRYAGRRSATDGDLSHRLGEMLSGGRPSPADEQYRREAFAPQTRPVV